MTSHPLIIGNWKMNTTLAEAMVLAERVKRGAEDIHHTEIVICPPSVWLYPIVENYKRGCPPNLKVGAQNVSWHDQGAYTGEISAYQIKSLVKYVLVGHSEQIKHFGLTDEKIALTARAVLDQKITPVVVVGELKKSASSRTHLANRLKRILKHVSKIEYENIVVAYEPVWAIGTGKAATGAYAETVCQEIKKIVGENTRILYGGSVHAENVREFVLQPSINGVLAGTSSLKAKDFLEMAKKLTL